MKQSMFTALKNMTAVFKRICLFEAGAKSPELFAPLQDLKCDKAAKLMLIKLLKREAQKKFAKLKRHQKECRGPCNEDGTKTKPGRSDPHGLPAPVGWAKSGNEALFLGAAMAEAAEGARAVQEQEQAQAQEEKRSDQRAGLKGSASLKDGGARCDDEEHPGSGAGFKKEPGRGKASREGHDPRLNHEIRGTDECFSPKSIEKGTAGGQGQVRIAARPEDGPGRTSVEQDLKDGRRSDRVASNPKEGYGPERVSPVLKSEQSQKRVDEQGFELPKADKEGGNAPNCNQSLKKEQASLRAQVLEPGQEQNRRTGQQRQERSAGLEELVQGTAGLGDKASFGLGPCVQARAVGADEGGSAAKADLKAVLENSMRPALSSMPESLNEGPAYRNGFANPFKVLCYAKLLSLASSGRYSFNDDLSFSFKALGCLLLGEGDMLIEDFASLYKKLAHANAGSNCPADLGTMGLCSVFGAAAILSYALIKTGLSLVIVKVIHLRLEPYDSRSLKQSLSLDDLPYAFAGGGSGIFNKIAADESIAILGPEDEGYLCAQKSAACDAASDNTLQAQSAKASLGGGDEIKEGQKGGNAQGRKDGLEGREAPGGKDRLERGNCQGQASLLFKKDQGQKPVDENCLERGGVDDNSLAQAVSDAKTGTQCAVSKICPKGEDGQGCANKDEAGDGEDDVKNNGSAASCKSLQQENGNLPQDSPPQGAKSLDASQDKADGGCCFDKAGTGQSPVEDNRSHLADSFERTPASALQEQYAKLFMKARTEALKAFQAYRQAQSTLLSADRSGIRLCDPKTLLKLRVEAMAKLEEAKGVLLKLQKLKMGLTADAGAECGTRQAKNLESKSKSNDDNCKDNKSGTGCPGCGRDEAGSGRRPTDEKTGCAHDIAPNAGLDEDDILKAKSLLAAFNAKEGHQEKIMQSLRSGTLSFKPDPAFKIRGCDEQALNEIRLKTKYRGHSCKELQYFRAPDKHNISKVVLKDFFGFKENRALLRDLERYEQFADDSLDDNAKLILYSQACTALKSIKKDAVLKFIEANPHLIYAFRGPACALKKYQRLDSKIRAERNRSSRSTDLKAAVRDNQEQQKYREQLSKAQGQEDRDE